jgi:ABC-2 type transport system ATP-binding protein
LTGNEFLQFAGKMHGVESSRLRCRVGELLERLDLTPWRDERIEGYSHGMKQRIVVCAALLHEPRILIVDEPMVGMDPRGARALKDLFRALAENGTAVFLKRLSRVDFGTACRIALKVQFTHVDIRRVLSS